MNISEKINSLPIELQNYFCSSQPRIVLEKSCFLYEIFEDDISKLTPTIANIFLGEQDLTRLPIYVERTLHVNTRISHGIAYEINKNMFCKFPDYFQDAAKLLEKWEGLKTEPLLVEEKAWRRVLDLEPWLEQEEKEKEMATQREAEEKKKTLELLDKLPLVQALGKYQRLGEQSITMNMLKLPSSESPVKPSINNWLIEYRDFAGPGKHNTMERGNFIFHNDNAKRLTAPERQKLTVILRSLDEDIPVYIDGELQQVVFIEDEPTEQRQVPKTRPTMPSPSNFTPQSRTRIEQKPMQSGQMKSSVDMASSIKTQTEKNYNVAPFGKTIQLADMSHLQNLPIKQAPQASMHRESVQAPQVSAPSSQQARVEQYFAPRTQPTQRPQQRPMQHQDDNLYAPDPQIPQGPRAASSGRPMQSRNEFAGARTLPTPKPDMHPMTMQKPATSQKHPAEKIDGGLGTVSYSSPQRLSSERNDSMTTRGRFRIKPHGYSEEDFSDPNVIPPSDVQGLI